MDQEQECLQHDGLYRYRRGLPISFVFPSISENWQERGFDTALDVTPERESLVYIPSGFVLVGLSYGGRPDLFWVYRQCSFEYTCGDLVEGISFEKTNVRRCHTVQALRTSRPPGNVMVELCAPS